MAGSAKRPLEVMLANAGYLKTWTGYINVVDLADDFETLLAVAEKLYVATSDRELAPSARFAYEEFCDRLPKVSKKDLPPTPKKKKVKKRS